MVTLSHLDRVTLLALYLWGIKILGQWIGCLYSVLHSLPPWSLKWKQITILLLRAKVAKWGPSLALCSPLKGHSQHHTGPATALVWQSLMRNPHKREVSRAQKGRLPFCTQCVLTHLRPHCDLSQHCPPAPQAAGSPHRNALTRTTPVSILKCSSGSFWSFVWGHRPVEQHHRVSSWALGSIDKSLEAQRPMTMPLSWETTPSGWLVQWKP